MPARRKAKATTNQDGSNVEESTEVSVDSTKVTNRQNKGKESEETTTTDTTTESAQTGQSEPPTKKKKGRKGKEVASEQSADAGKQDDKSAEEPTEKGEFNKQESKAIDGSPKKGAKTQPNKSAVNEEAVKKTAAKAQANKKVNKAKKTSPSGEAGDRVLRSNSRVKNGYVTIFLHVVVQLLEK